MEREDRQTGLQMVTSEGRKTGLQMVTSEGRKTGLQMVKTESCCTEQVVVGRLVSEYKVSEGKHQGI